MRHPIPLCALITCLLWAGAASAADGLSTKERASASAAMESGELARSLAGTIIHERALEFAAAGREILSLQLESLAKGLLDGKITLYDASLVMQVVGSAAAPAAASTLTTQAKTSVQRAQSLLDGSASPASTPEAPREEPSAEAHLSQALSAPATTALIPTPKVLISEVCGVQNGDDHHVMVAALSANTKDGLVKGEHVVFKLKGKLVAQGTVLRLDDNLTFVEITKGSQVDPAQDVTEQCQAIITPSP